ncbi:hypothetical protein EDC96DRAFT_529549 [Choanephora cucurbitarum]|nr:hypothetical protein EDC96DRAFT_529549 [Choanephora cucurbitarum]
MSLRRALNPQVTKKYICKLTASYCVFYPLCYFTDFIMTSRHHTTFKQFFESCNEVDGEISFERFIKSHHVYIKTNMKSSADDYASWCRDFKKSASACGVKAVLDNAFKAWCQLITPKKSKKSKRTYEKSNVVEEFEALKENLAENADLFKEFNSFRRAAIAEFKENGKTRCFSEDLVRLLACQGIFLLGDVVDANTAKFFGEKTLKAQKKKIREERFGNYRRMPTSLRDEIQSVLDDFHDDDDLEKLENSLRNMKMNATDPVAARVLKVLVSLLDHMIEEEVPCDETRLQSGVLPALCQAFKLSRKHDAYGCNKVLFPSFDALKQCRPDFVVRVQGQNDLFNVAIEIKEAKASKEKCYLDTYRLGLFGLKMLWEHKLENSLVIQVVGADVTFFLCFLLSGVCVMMEVDTITLPITYKKYGDIMSHLNAMYNISYLYEKHCVVVEEEEKKAEWQLISFDAVKLMYDIHSTTKTSTVCNQSNIFSSSNASTAL